MASSKKGSGTSRLEKGVNGRRSSKHKEGPLGEVFFLFLILSTYYAPSVACPFNNTPAPQFVRCVLLLTSVSG